MSPAQTGMKQRLARSITGTRANPATAISELHATKVPPPDQMLPICPTAARVAGATVVIWPRAPDSDPVRGRPEKPEPSRPAIMPIIRMANAVTTRSQRNDATMLRRMLAAHRDVRELIEIGAYVAGSNPDADRARALLPRINDFLRQDMEDSTPAPMAWALLNQLVNEGTGG